MQRMLLVALTLFALAATPMSLAQDAPRGVLTHTTHALEGYTLVAPQIDSKVYLIDNAGHIAHERSWACSNRPRTARCHKFPQCVFTGGQRATYSEDPGDRGLRRKLARS